jgi:hypothetical protein
VGWAGCGVWCGWGRPIFPNEIYQGCIQQWGESAQHDAVSAEFLDPRQSLRRDVELIEDDGTGLSAELQREVDALDQIPLDDTAGEGPHAVANVLSTRARHSSWAWIASSMRLEQNLTDLSDLLPAVDANLEAQWDIYKSVVQPPGRRQSTPKRMTRKKFEDSVYHLADCCARVGGEDTEPAEDVLIPDNFGDGADAVAAPIGNMDLLFGLKYVKKRFRNL